MSQEEIEDEVKARVAFKLKEILQNCKNTAGQEWTQAFINNSAKHENYWQAFKRFEQMVLKEATLPVPFNKMAERDEWEFKEKLMDEVKATLMQEHIDYEVGRYNRIVRKLVSIVEQALKFRNR